MKKNVFVVFIATLLLFSCSQENVKEDVTTSANLILQQDAWKIAEITPLLIENQKQISHYDFDALSLQKLVNNKEASMVWFDLGVNKQEQITFSATVENKNGVVLADLPSTIISVNKKQIDFSFLLDNTNPAPSSNLTHILSGNDAFHYLLRASDYSTNFEASLSHNSVRVERFGMSALIVKQILQTEGIHSLALFFGVNDAGKRTTVFIAKDINGQFIINNTVRAWDFTSPCPPQCDPDDNYGG